MKAQTKTEVKETPIIFSGEMVKAILDGRKTQTRRVIKPEPDWLPEVKSTRPGGPFIWPVGSLGQQCGTPLFNFPYGHAGDRLWVKEVLKCDDKGMFYAADGARIPADQIPDDLDVVREVNAPSHMPRWATRITLEIENVRVERLQDISEEDAKAEGLLEWQKADCKNAQSKRYGNSVADVWEKDPRQAFARIWDSINGKKHPWESNPWVWVVEFKRLANGK